MSSPGLRVAVYTRLSLDREGEMSTERQEADCRALAGLRGWEVGQVYTDRLSGFRPGVRRPQYEALLADLTAGRWAAVLVWKLDRLTRQGVKEIARLLGVLEAGKALLVSVQDSIDTSTPMGQGVLALLGSMAQQESQNTSVRTASAGRARAAAGLPKRAGFRPYGFAGDFVTHVPAEAEQLRDAARRVAAGEPVYSVVAEWNRAGLRTSAGGLWSTTVLRRVLLGARWRGLREYGGAVIGPAAWEAVLSAEVGARLDTVLTVRRRSRPARSYLLTGIVRCGVCGGPLVPRAREGGVRRYVCVPAAGGKSVPGSCGAVLASADGLERFVVAALLGFLEHAELRTEPEGEALDLFRGLEAVRGRLDRAEEAFVEGLLEKGRYREIRQGVLEESARLEDRLAALPLGGVPLDVVSGWEGLTLEQRRSVVRAWFPRITVRSAGRGNGPVFRPERVSLEDARGRIWSLADPETLSEAGGGLLPLR